MPLRFLSVAELVLLCIFLAPTRIEEAVDVEGSFVRFRNAKSTFGRKFDILKCGTEFNSAKISIEIRQPAFFIYY